MYFLLFNLTNASNLRSILRKPIYNIIKKHTKVKIQLWAANSIKELLHNQKIKNYEKTPKSGMPKLPKDYFELLILISYLNYLLY